MWFEAGNTFQRNLFFFSSCPCSSTCFGGARDLLERRSASEPEPVVPVEHGSLNLPQEKNGLSGGWQIRGVWCSVDALRLEHVDFVRTDKAVWRNNSPIAPCTNSHDVWQVLEWFGLEPGRSCAAFSTPNHKVWDTTCALIWEKYILPAVRHLDDWNKS